MVRTATVRWSLTDALAGDFSVSVMLRDSDMVMYDRNTESLWQQITDEAAHIFFEATSRTAMCARAHFVRQSRQHRSYARLCPERAAARCGIEEEGGCFGAGF
jgi:hypothetical protein